MGQSRVEDILEATIEAEPYTEEPQSRVEELLIELKETIEENPGGASEVEANPSGEGTADLTKLKVGNNIYDIPTGGGGIESPHIYRICGVFVDSPTDTDFFGRGVADITITGNLARIDFQITTKMNNYTGRSDVYDWGINPALISQLNGDIPLITPIAGSGTWDPFNFNSDRMNFGTSFEVLVGNDRWTPTRNYLIDDPTAYGAWSEHEMPWPFRGTCYGTIN